MAVSVITKEDTKNLTALLAGIAGLATAVASCNQSAQERLKADNKIYSVLADGQKQQASDLVEIHHQLDELRGYLQALRAAPEPAAPPPAPPAALLPALRPLTRYAVASAAPPPEPTPLPPLPSAAPAPVLRPLPRFEDLASAP